jgi:hypothetical protein
MHRDTVSETEMLEITTGAGRVRVSARHYLWTDQGHAAAGDIIPGQQLLTPAGAVYVQSIELVASRGALAPLTATSNFFVGASNSSLVLAHSFAHFPPSLLAEGLIHSVISVAEWVLPNVNSVRGDVYIHPIAKVLAPLVGLALGSHEKKVEYRRLEEKDEQSKVPKVLPTFMYPPNLFMQGRGNRTAQRGSNASAITGSNTLKQDAEPAADSGQQWSNGSIMGLVACAFLLTCVCCKLCKGKQAEPLQVRGTLVADPPAPPSPTPADDELAASTDGQREEPMDGQPVNSRS